MHKVVGGVDIAGELRVATHHHVMPALDREGEVAVERAGAVAEREAEVGRNSEHVGAIAMGVGHEGDRIGLDQRGEVVGQR